MASENQGMQAALIILVILVILLSVATFMFFTASRDYQNRFNTTKTELDAKTASELKMQDEFNRLMAIIGLEVTSTGNLDNAEKAFSDDMKAYAATVPEDKRYYRTAIEQLYKDLTAANTQVTQLQEQLTTEQAKNIAFEAASKKQVDEANAARDAAVAELAAEKDKFMAAQTQAEDEKKRALDLVEKTQQEKAAEVENLNKEIEAGKNEIVFLKKELDKAKTSIVELRPDNPNAIDDGYVRQVDRRRGIAWIDRGSADGLRPGVTFSVHSADTRPGDDKAVKGKLEVLSIVNDHLAECSILDDKLSDPILPGDRIYTHLWDPGRGVSVAIIGRVDLDGDGTDDRSRLVNLIKAHGGTIDASLDDDGKEDGQLQFSTRYLIVGDTPSQKAQTAYARMLEQAKTLGVQAIGASRFLDEIGFRTSPKVVRYGPGGNADSAARLDADGGVPSVQSGPINAFQQRRPPLIRPQSAY